MYRAALNLYPESEPLVLAYCQVLLQSGDTAPCRSHLERFTQSASASSEVYRTLSELEAREGHQGESHLALAEFYLREGEKHAALEQLNFAKNYNQEDFYFTNRVEARSNELRGQLDLDREDPVK
jgi:predicted Zn-dependent protease